MQYRHPQGVRLALTSGHVTHVGTEWQPLDERFHTEALLNGCQIDEGIVDTGKKVANKASPEGFTNTDDTSVIRSALQRMIVRNKQGDFTASDLPNLKVLAHEAGIPIDKDLAYGIFRDLVAEATGGNGSGE